MAPLSIRPDRGPNAAADAARTVPPGPGGTECSTGAARETATEGMLVLDHCWCFTYLNPAAARLLERPAGELLGHSLWEQFPAAIGTAFERQYRQALAGSHPVEFEAFFAPLDLWVKVRACPLTAGLVVFFHDVRRLPHAPPAAEPDAARLRAILNSLPAHTCVIEPDGTISSTNHSWDRFATSRGGQASSCGQGANYLLACSRSADRGDQDAARVLTGLQDLLAAGTGQFCHEYECSSPDEQRWFAITAAPVRGAAGLVISHSDITARVKAEQRAAFQATHDLLTGLPNSRHLRDALDRFLGQAGPGGIAMLYCDLDYFTTIISSLGAELGDLLLQAVAERLAAAIRPGDLLARVGSEQLAILAPDCDVQRAQRLAGSVRRALQAPFQVGGISVSLTASIGVATGSAAAAPPPDLLGDAGAAMYEAQRQGRDRCHVFTPELRTRARGRVRLLADLQAAIEDHELVAHFQPVVELATGRPASAEALVRWNHPQLGSVAPDQFIPLAEHSGLVIPLGRWMLREGTRTAAGWRDQGIGCGVSVNIAAQHLGCGTLVEDVRAALAEAELPPGGLCVELTETSLEGDQADAAAQLQELRTLGVQIALDDFGTGYSSLGRLVDLPVDILKLDRSLVRRLATEDPRPAAVISAAIGIAANLGMTTVAEGVETRQQHDRLRRLGCPLGQGYLFSRPVPADQAEIFLADAAATEDRPTGSAC